MSHSCEPDEDRANATDKARKRQREWEETHTRVLRTRTVVAQGWKKDCLPDAESTLRARELAQFACFDNIVRHGFVVRGGVEAVFRNRDSESSPPPLS